MMFAKEAEASAHAEPRVEKSLLRNQTVSYGEYPSLASAS